LCLKENIRIEIQVEYIIQNYRRDVNNKRVTRVTTELVGSVRLGLPRITSGHHERVYQVLKIRYLLEIKTGIFGF